MSAKTSNRAFYSQHYLSSHFEQSRADVMSYADWIEQRYARPAFRMLQSYSQDHPLLAVFFGVFVMLSLLPITIYLGICLFSLVLLLLSALSVVGLVFFVVALALGSILILVLSLNLLLSVFITFSFANTYFVYKIVVAGYTGGLRGARLQIVELFNSLFSGAQAIVSRKSPDDTRPDGDYNHSELLDTSGPDSTVIIDNAEVLPSSASEDDAPAEMKLEESEYQNENA